MPTMMNSSAGTSLPINMQAAAGPGTDRNNNEINFISPVAYVQSGLALWFAILYIVFIVVEIPWCLLQTLGYLPNAKDYYELLAVLSIVIPFMYYIWVNNSMHGYTYRPEQYRRLLIKICSLAEAILFCIEVSATDGIDDTLINYQTSGNGSSLLSDGTELARFAFMKNIKEDITRTFVCLASCSLNLFTHKPIDTAEINDLLQSKFIRDKDKAHMALRNLISTKSKHLHANTTIKTLLSVVSYDMKVLIKNKFIRTADLNMINEDIRFIKNLMEDVDVSDNVFDPPLFKNHLHLTLAVYFLLWPPFVMGTMLGWYALLVYPNVMVILTGIPTIRTWLRDPFDSRRPIRYMPFEQWRLDCIRDIKMAACVDSIEDNEEETNKLNGSPLPINLGPSSSSNSNGSHNIFLDVGSVSTAASKKKSNSSSSSEVRLNMYDSHKRL